MKKKIASLILVASFVLSILCGAFGVSANAASVSLSVPKYKQEQTNWCWAAAARMAGIYKKWTSTYIQTQIVTDVKGSAMNATGTANETGAAISYVTDNTYPGAWTSTKWSFDKVQTSINNDYPICPLVYESFSGHFYVIVGYNSNTSTLYLNDPYTGGSTSCSWSNFVNGDDTGNWDSRPFYHTAFFLNYDS